MTVFKRHYPQIGKRQTKLYLSEAATERLKAVAAASGQSMSVVVEVLILDYCRKEDEVRQPKRRAE